MLYAKVMIKQWLHDQPLSDMCHPAPGPCMPKTAESLLVRRRWAFPVDGVCFHYYVGCADAIYYSQANRNMHTVGIHAACMRGGNCLSDERALTRGSL